MIPIVLKKPIGKGHTRVYSNHINLSAPVEKILDLPCLNGLIFHKKFEQFSWLIDS